MATLTLTEGGASRRFKLSTGKATVGSGPEAALRLTSEDVADIHGEFEMTDEGLVLRTARGVLPPTLAGKPVPREYVLEDGAPLALGDATLSVAYAEGEGPVRPAHPVRSAPVVAASGSLPRSAESPVRMRSRAEPAEPGDDEDRPRRRVRRKSDPSGLILGAVIFIGLVGAGYWVVNATASGLAGQNFDYESELRRARRQIEEDGSPLAAKRALEGILAEDISPAQRRDVTGLLDELSKRSSNTSNLMRNAEGTKWFQKRIQAYMDRRPVTRERGYARAFLSRTDYFFERWPNHPEEERIRGMVERVSSVAEADEPMTADDVDVIVASWADIRPPEFYEAYAILDEYVRETTDELDLERAALVRKQTAEKEQAYYESQLKKAQSVYTKVGPLAKNVKPGQAIHDLASIIARCADSELKADAARRLVMITEMTPKFIREQYQVGRPVFWERMILVPAFADWARTNGML